MRSRASHLSRVGLAVGLLLCASCATVRSAIKKAFQEPEVEFQKLHLRNLSFEDVTLDFEFLVTNPNSVGVTLASLDYALDMDGKSLAKGESNEELRLEAKGSAPVKLPLTVTFSDLADNLATLFSSRETVPYRINAGFGLKTPIGPVRVPVENQGEVPLPKVPEVKVANFRLAKLSLTEARLELALDVKNRGQFPIQPKGLRYDVNVAGASISSGDETLPNLAANASQRVTIPLRVNFLRLGAAAVEAIRSREVPYRVAGSLDLGVFAQPFNLSGRAKL